MCLSAWAAEEQEAPEAAAWEHGRRDRLRPGAHLTPAAPPGRPENLRLFLALDLPGGARRELARWRDSIVGGRDELRPVADEALHVTLVFLGRREAAVAQTVWETVAGAISGLTAPRFVARAGAWVPPRRARLLAVDLEDRQAQGAAVQGAVSAALVEAGLHEAEARPFWPHVTVARVRGQAKVRATSPVAIKGIPFEAPLLTLYRSDLHPAGARYVALERLRLGGGGR